MEGEFLVPMMTMMVSQDYIRILELGSTISEFLESQIFGIKFQILCPPAGRDASLLRS